MFYYLGSTKENHSKLESLGLQVGLQNIRKRTIGEQIAWLANNRGDIHCARICMQNPEFFKYEKDI